jgi:hypothetical protein
LRIKEQETRLTLYEHDDDDYDGNLGLLSRQSDYNLNNTLSIPGNNNSLRECPSCSGKKHLAFARLCRQNTPGLVTARPRLGQLYLS